MRIIGIDPGLASTGYGVIEDDGKTLTLIECGTIVTTNRDSTAVRLREIHSVLLEVSKRTKPQVVAIEGLYFVQNITSGIAVAQGRGVAILGTVLGAVEESGCEPDFVEYTPMQIKRSVVGYGKATKNQVIQMVQRLLHISDKSGNFTSHAADALAAAICHAHAYKYDNALKKAKLKALLARQGATPKVTAKKRGGEAAQSTDAEIESIDSKTAKGKLLLKEMLRRSHRRKRRRI